MNKRKLYVHLFLFFSITNHIYGRSIHRPNTHLTPEIKTRWCNGNTFHTLKDSHLEEYAIFKTFDKSFFYGHMLPKGTISFRNKPSESVQGKVLTDLVEELLVEVQKKKKKFKHFTVLRKVNFNTKLRCGLLILKFKDHPFVLKLFIENPKTFVNPYAKGFEPMCFFVMAGGINRHLTGFTRIKNLGQVRKKIQTHDHWSKIIDFPRKWFWLPNNSRWIEITGHNIGNKKKLTTKLPSVYGIIADAIKADKTFSLFNKNEKKVGMELCNYLEHAIDPHIDNFMREKATNKIIMVDTEHFPSVVGLKQKNEFHNYISWYTFLALKCSKDGFFRTKRERKEAQKPSGFELL